MQRIRAVLQKLTDLSQRNPERTAIEIDLMLDFTRVVYADLLELRAQLDTKKQPDVHEPTLDELTEAMAAQEDEDEDELPAEPMRLIIKDEIASSRDAVVAEPVKQPEPEATPLPKSIAPEPKKEPIHIPVTIAPEQVPLKPLPIPAPEPAPLKPLPIPTPEPEPLKPLPIPAAVTTKPVKDIRTFIDLNEKYLFLGELFNNDIRAYEETMKELSLCETKQQAKQLLGTKFWNEDNIAFESFQSLMDRYFA